MAPSLSKTVGAAAVALAAHAGATKSYKVSEVYNSTNFFDKFNFVTDSDPNGGYVQYQSQANAKNLGLIKYQDDEVYIGVDHTKGDYSPSGVGRKSVRLESKNVYNHGLVIADFTYLPKPVCGSWPAFWFFGEPWPTKGEIDIYENWNDLTFNRHTAHVDDPDVVGECKLVADGMTATIDSSNCYDFAEGQWEYQGCSASEYSATFGSSSGGIFAMEWTEDYLKIWDWPRASAPQDILKGKPSPSLLWGLPSYMIKECDIDKAFRDMKMVFNIDFCAVAGQTDKWGASCKAKTGYATCPEYVAKKNDDFSGVNFKVKDIRIYQQVEDPATSSSTSTTSSTVSTSTSSSAILTTSSTTLSTSSVSTLSSSVSFSNSSSTSSASYSATSSSASDDDDETCTDDNGDSSSSYVVSPTRSVSATTTGSSTGSLATGGGYPTLGQATTSSSSGAVASTDSSNSYIVSATQELTTSTIYTTTVHTITSCAPTVTNCPAGGYVTTEVISIGTTVCPVTGTGSQPKPTTTAGAPGSYATSTVEVTRTYAITSCAPTVTNCPVGSITTEVGVTTTVYPVGNGNAGSSSSKPAGGSSVVNKPSESTGIVSNPGSESQATNIVATTYIATANNPANPSATGSSNSGSGNSEVGVVVTATVVPVTSVNVGYNATLTSVTYPGVISTESVVPVSSGIVEVSGGIKTGVSFTLMGTAALFFLVL